MNKRFLNIVVCAILLFTFMPLASAELIENFSSPNGSMSSVLTSQWFSMSFRVGLTAQAPLYNLETLSVRAYRQGNIPAPGLLQLNLTSANASGYPNMSDIIASTSVNISTLTTSNIAQWVNFTIPTVAQLFKGRNYSIVLSCTSCILSSDDFNWVSDPSGGNYSGGSGFMSANNGSTWTTVAPDYLFEAFGTPSQFIVNSQTYNTQTTVLNTENFEINITVINSSLTSADAIFTYNNTNYTPTESGTGSNFKFVASVAIPSVLNTTSKSFFWNIILGDGTTTQLYKTTTNTQQINLLSIDNCSSNNIRILNLTLRDEDTRNLVTQNQSIEVEMSLQSITNSLQRTVINFTFINQSNVAICIGSGFTSATIYRADTIIKYSSADRVIEYYNIQNFTLMNTTIPQNINLYDLLISRSQEFLITYKDRSFIPLANALIEMTRKYIGLGTFLTIEVPKTDSDGKTLGHFVLSDEIYTINVKKDGVLLATFENVRPVCANQATGDCKLNLNELGSTTNPQNFQNYLGVTYDTNFNRTTRLFTWRYSSVDGSSKEANLTGKLFDNYGNQTICGGTANSPSATVTCQVPANTVNTSITFTGYINGQELFTESHSLISTPGDDTTRYILGALLICLLSLMGISRRELVLVFYIIGIVICSMLFLVDFGIIGGASALMWFIVASGLVIIKTKGAVDG